MTTPYQRQEFMVPETEPLHWCRQVHLDRYHFACDFLAPASEVLDVGCGAGYGAQMMAHQTDASVVALDKSETAIGYAREHYPAPNLTYMVADATQPLRLGLFDVVVSFDVMEHLESTTVYLHNILRHLRREDSVALISTVHSMLTNTVNPSRFHKREYTLGEFHDLLADHFFISELLMSMGMVAILHKPTGQQRQMAYNTPIGIPYFRRIEDELNRQCRRVAELESEVAELRAHDYYPPTVDVPSRFLPLRALQLWHKAGSRYLIHRLGLWLAWNYR